MKLKRKDLLELRTFVIIFNYFQRLYKSNNYIIINNKKVHNNYYFGYIYNFISHYLN